APHRDRARRRVPDPMRRLTIRMRLTLLWGLLFLAAGTALLGLFYLFARDSLGDQLTTNGIHVVVQGAGPGGDPLQRPPTDLPFIRELTPEQRAQLDRGLLQVRQDTLNTLLTRSAIGLGAVALVGMGFGWLMAERALRPLAQITETARRVA